MNLVKMLNQYTDAQLKNIYSRAIDCAVQRYGGSRQEWIEENKQDVATQYSWVRSKRSGIRYTLAAINTTRAAMQTEKHSDEWLEMVRSWADA